MGTDVPAGPRDHYASHQGPSGQRKYDQAYKEGPPDCRTNSSHWPRLLLGYRPCIPWYCHSLLLPDTIHAGRHVYQTSSRLFISCNAWQSIRVCDCTAPTKINSLSTHILSHLIVASFFFPSKNGFLRFALHCLKTSMHNITSLLVCSHTPYHLPHFLSRSYWRECWDFYLPYSRYNILPYNKLRIKNSLLLQKHKYDKIHLHMRNKYI